MLNLDTHILVHNLEDALTPAERRILTANEWSISPIVLWEIAKLAQGFRRGQLRQTTAA